MITQKGKIYKDNGKLGKHKWCISVIFHHPKYIREEDKLPLNNNKPDNNRLCHPRPLCLTAKAMTASDEPTSININQNLVCNDTRAPKKSHMETLMQAFLFFPECFLSSLFAERVTNCGLTESCFFFSI